MDRIVISDPINEFKQGVVVSGENEIARLERRRVAMLPIDPDLLHQPAAGYYFRSWGRGVHVNRNAGTRVCPMVLFVDPKRPFIYWSARVEPIDPELDTHGQIRLVTIGASGHTLSGGLSADSFPKLQHGARDESGGWTVYGRGRLSISMDGWLGLSLYATARNVRILWSSVSQSSILADV